MNIKNRKQNKGFTILETLIAVVILSLVLNSVFTLISGTLFSSQYAKNEMIASYLLQESVDYIRNSRDSFLKDTTSGWSNFLGFYSINGASSSFCSINTSPESNKTPNCNNGTIVVDKLFYNPDFYRGSYYSTEQSPSGSLPTSYTRSVMLSKQPSVLDEVDVTVTVSWKNGTVTKSKTYHSSLLNWQ